MKTTEIFVALSDTLAHAITQNHERIAQEGGFTVHEYTIIRGIRDRVGGAVAHRLNASGR